MLVPGLGIRLMPLAVEAQILITGLPEKPPACHFEEEFKDTSVHWDGFQKVQQDSI